MKITITGASSFIGKKLMEKAVMHGHSCTAVVRRGKEKLVRRLPGFEKSAIIEMEMKDYGDLYREAGGADCLIHLAWRGTRGEGRMNREMQEESCRQAVRAAESMAQGALKLVVTAGSQAEYGSSSGILTESSPPLPVTEYGKYKLKLYHELSSFCAPRNIKVIDPRFFSLYGPGDAEQTMIVSMVHKMLGNEACNLTESVQMWDFLHVDDAADALLALIEKDAQGGIYNFASGDCRPLKEFVEEMRNILGSRSVLNYGAVRYPDTGMVSFQPDNTKLKEAAGWLPAISFPEGIRMVKASLLEGAGKETW